MRIGLPARQVGPKPPGALAAVGALLTALSPAAAQEIIQAQVLDLTVLEVQVIVTGAQGEDQVQCLLRDTAGHIRIARAQRVGTGVASGRTTIVPVPLPILNPQETEFSVNLVRGDRVLDRTAWRPLFSKP